MSQTNMRMNTTNPLVQVLAVIGGLLLFTAALFIGAFMFIALLGLAVIAGTLLSLRVWWLRRQLRRGAERNPGQARRQHRGYTIEGEVVNKRQDRSERR